MALTYNKNLSASDVININKAQEYQSGTSYSLSNTINRDYWSTSGGGGKNTLHGTDKNYVATGWTDTDLSAVRNYVQQYESVQNALALQQQQARYDAMLASCQNDELYAAYPQIKDIRVVNGNFGNKLPKASFSEKLDAIIVNTNRIKDDNDLRSSLLHEIQHSIQKTEGFEHGGFPAGMKTYNRNLAISELETSGDATYQRLKNGDKKELIQYIDNKIKEIYNTDTVEEANKIAYRNLMGEKEARSVQNRMLLDADDRKFYNPEYEEGSIRRSSNEELFSEKKRKFSILDEGAEGLSDDKISSGNRLGGIEKETKVLHASGTSLRGTEYTDDLYNTSQHLYGETGNKYMEIPKAGEAACLFRFLIQN